MFTNNQIAVYGLLNTGTAFQNPMAGNFNTVSTLSPQLTSQVTYLQGTGQINPTQAVQLQSQINNSQAQSIAMQSHSDTTIANLPQNLGAATYGIQSSQNLGIGTPDPCDQMNSFFGSLLGVGAGVMDNLVGLLSNLLELLLGGAIDAAMALLAEIELAIGAIASLIAGEIAALIAVMNLAGTIAEMSQLFNFLKTPCAMLLVNAVGTADLLANLRR